MSPSLTRHTPSGTTVPACAGQSLETCLIKAEKKPPTSANTHMLTLPGVQYYWELGYSGESFMMRRPCLSSAARANRQAQVQAIALRYFDLGHLGQHALGPSGTGAD